MNKGSLYGIIVIGGFVCLMGAILYKTGGNSKIAAERYKSATAAVTARQIQGSSNNSEGGSKGNSKNKRKGKKTTTKRK